MKLKNATQLAIIGVVIQLIPFLMEFMTRMYVLAYGHQEPNMMWYIMMSTRGILNIIGTAMLLPFFITLFKSQK